MKDDTLVDTIYTQAINYPAIEWVLIFVFIIIPFFYWLIWARPKQKIDDARNKETNAEVKEMTKINRKILKNLEQKSQQQNPNTTPTLPEQKQADKESIKSLLEANNPKAEQASDYLMKGNINGAVDVLEELDKEKPSVKTKLWLATILNYTNPSQAEHYLEQAVVLEPENLQALTQYGWLLIRLGNVDKAIEYYEKVLVISREINHSQGESSALGNLGNAYVNLGETDKAIEYYEKALAISIEIKNRQDEGNILSNLGSAYADLDKADKAIEYYEEALVIIREIKNRQDEGSILNNLGSVYYSLCKFDKAIKHHKKALVISCDVKNQECESSALNNLGSSYADLGEIEKAIEHYEKALAISREIKNRQGEGKTLGNLGLAYTDLGEVEKAIEYHEQSLVIFKKIGSPAVKKAEQYLKKLKKKSK